MYFTTYFTNEKKPVKWVWREKEMARGKQGDNARGKRGDKNNSKRHTEKY